MNWILNNILYLCIGLIGIYTIITSYYLSKVFIKYGKTEIFWFVILNALYPFVLCYILLKSESKNHLSQRDKKIVVSFLLIFIFFISSILILITVSGIETSYININLTTKAKYIETSIHKFSLPDWLLIPLLILMPFYCLFVAYRVSSIMNKLANGRAWFYSVLFFHVIILSYIIVNRQYRNRLNLNEKILIISFGVGYFMFALLALKALDI